MHCQAGVTHLDHFFPFCTCAAGGTDVRHSSHCHLDGAYLGYVPATLDYDDALIVAQPRGG